MDSQTRDELKENDLQSFITNFGDFWQKYGNYVMLVTVVVLASFALWRFVSIRAMERHEVAWADLSMATSPDSYAAVANDHSGNDVVYALANLRGADLLLEKIVRPTDGETPSEQELKNQLDQASQMYTRAASVKGVAPVYALNAHLGLASIYETQGKYDEAKSTYQKVIDTAGDRYRHIAEHAKVRLEMVDRLRTPVVFAPDPPRTADPLGDLNVPGGINIPSGIDLNLGDLPTTTEPAPTAPAQP